MNYGTKPKQVIALKAGVSALAVFVAAGTAMPAQAQDYPYDETFDPLGELDLPVVNPDYSSVPMLVNEDGTIVIMTTFTDAAIGPDGENVIAIWRPDSGVETIGLADTFLYAFDMSNDGSVIVGAMSGPGTYDLEAYRYTEAGGFEALGYLNGMATGQSIASFTSADGTVIVGRSSFSAETTYPTHTFRWTQEGGMVDIGTLYGPGNAYASAISSDGSIIVGVSNGLPFRWDESAGMADLGSLGGDIGFASHISSDGSVIVGQSSTGTVLHTFRWTESGGMIDIDTLNSLQSDPYGMSSDGSTIVGRVIYQTEGGYNNHAFRWTDATGMVDIGSLWGVSEAFAVSGDGNIVVGRSETNNGTFRAFRWTEEEGMVDLGTLGGYYSSAHAISEDGSTILGVYQRNAVDDGSRPFIYRTQMQDFTNLLVSFGGIAEETELAMAAPRERLRQIENPGCVGGGKTVCLGLAGYSWSGGARSLTGARAKEQAISLSAGFSPHRLVTLGVTHSWADNDMTGPRTTLQGNRAWSGWLHLGDGAKLTGPSVNAWYAKSRDDFALDRTAGIADVESAYGTSKLRGTSYGIGASYGIAIGDRWAIAPSASAARVRLRRGAYVETASDFPAGFDALEVEETRVTGGATFAGMVGPGILRLSAGAEHFGDSEPLIVSGTSQIPEFEAFTLESALDRHATRGRFAAGYEVPLGMARLGLSANASTAEYGSTWQLGVVAAVGLAF